MSDVHDGDSESEQTESCRDSGMDPSEDSDNVVKPYAAAAAPGVKCAQPT